MRASISVKELAAIPHLKSNAFMPSNNALVLTLPTSGQGSDVGGLRSGACASSVGAAPCASIGASVACPGNAAQRQPLDGRDEPHLNCSA